MIDWISEITRRDVFFMFFGSFVVWLIWEVTKKLLTDATKVAISDPGRAYRAVLMFVSGALAAGLSGEPALSPGMTLFMIICCLVFYWAITTQWKENAQNARRKHVETTSNENEGQIAREKANPKNVDQNENDRAQNHDR